jgi:membrane-bound lytic murein transglycosylase MltF
MFDLKKFMDYQVAEIKRHRYLTSQNVGFDRGKEAEYEWVRLYAKQVREWAEKSELFQKGSKMSNIVQINNEDGLRWELSDSKLDEVVKYLHANGNHSPQTTQDQEKECQK